MADPEHRMDNDLPILSFPPSPPVTEVTHSPGSVIFYVTLPIKIFAPAFSRLSEGKNTTLYLSHMRILTMMIYLFNKKFRSLDQHRRLIEGTELERFSVYFEYLVSDKAEVDNAQNFETTLINCVGIRFYFVQNETDGNDIIQALSQQILEQGGIDPETLNPKKKPSTKKNSVGANPNNLYNFYARYESMAHWYNDVVTYMGGSEWGTFDYDAQTEGDSLVPYADHPLSPKIAFSFEKSCITGVHPRHKNHSTKPAFPKMCFKIPPVMLSPIALLCVTLPSTTAWTRQSDAGINETMRTFRDIARMEKYYTAGYIKKNDLRDIRKLNIARTEEVTKKYSGERLVKEKKKIATETVRSLQDVWCDTASVSDPIKIMSRYQMEFDSWTMETPLIVWDAELSYFGNLVASDMWAFEVDFGISTTHSILYRLMICAMNSYRYKMALHTNMLLCGSGATGKSHMLETIEKIFIPGTTTKVTHSTDKASAVDSDNNDHISLYHEAPPGFLGAGDKNSDQSTGSHLLKDLMTSCHVTTDTIHVDSDTGRRHKVKCDSECVGVFLIATNERADSIPEALATRMQNICVDTVNRPGFNVVDKADSQPSEASEKARISHVKRWRMRQLMVNMVEKAIFTGCLRDVEVSIPRSVYAKMVNHMEKTGLIGSGTTVRGKSFLINFVRTLTIIHAVDKFANDPSSPGYKKKITFENLMAIQPYLVASEEITLFCLTLCADTLIDINNFRVTEVITGTFAQQIHRSKGKPHPVDGYYIAKQVPENRGLMYSKMNAHIAGNKTYHSRLSAENMKVAYNALNKTTYKGEPVIIEGGSESSDLHINAKFLDAFFKWDTSLDRFVTNLDVSEVLITSFNNSYVHAHMPSKRKFITGSTIGTQLPFIFESVFITPNKERIYEWHNVSIGLFDDIDIADDFSDKHLEDKVLSDYMNGDESNTAKELLYDQSIGSPKLSGTYPQNLISWFVKKHGVKVHNKRYRTDEEYKSYQQTKRSKLDQVKNN